MFASTSTSKFAKSVHFSMFASTSTSKFAKSVHFQSYFSEQLKRTDSASSSTFAK